METLKILDAEIELLRTERKLKAEDLETLGLTELIPNMQDKYDFCILRIRFLRNKLEG